MRRLLALFLTVVLSLAAFVSCSSISRVTRPFDIDKVGGDLKQANLDFALNVFKEVNKEDKDINVFISPLSISAALTMTYQGASGTTREAMAKALQINGIETGVLNEGYKNLLNYLSKVDSKVQLDIANSIWIREGFGVKEDFIKTNKEIFNAKVASLDFSDNKAADTINQWISKATKGKIEKMLEAPIKPDIIMYLINAIYFKGQWTVPFDKNQTFDSKFNSYSGDINDVRMMQRTGKAKYGRGDDYKAVRLPYGNGKISMYCILPDERMDINDFIRDLDSDKWAEIKDSIKEQNDVRLEIPRFNMEYGIKNLNDVLTNMGMGEAFSDYADFSGIADNVAISRVLHKAVIEVNEEGSTAAGVTVVEMRETAAILDPPSFIADRPFLFAIADDDTGTILFIGKLLNV